MATWMIRGERGRLYDVFRDQGIVAIGWEEIASDVRADMSRADLTALYASRVPGISQASAIAGASQVWRFVNEIQVGDEVLSYSPGNRTYIYGQVKSPFSFCQETADDGMALIRQVDWWSGEIPRDQLTLPTRNTLGSTLTVFLLPESAALEVQAVARKVQSVAEHEVLKSAKKDLTVPTTPGRTPHVGDADLGAAMDLDAVDQIALERIKDSVVKLGWDEVQELVAGILRAMGYKTQVSPPGPDRGRDIIASPDGFGFESPRIVVEVKHRTSAMGSEAIRAFTGGRHPLDRGLYVSTGGFTREAKYEADRSNVPLTLWDVDVLVRTLVEYYETTDSETKRLVPLKRIYIPA
jgi:restriction system protein